jgi:hypothetical protein
MKIENALVRAKTRNDQTGQATIEFVIFALFVLIPLFFGIYYLAKYSDVKSAANQASRYAAFERSWDPAGTKTDAVIQNEMQVRFFSGKQEVAFQDSPATIGVAEEIPLWKQANQSKLLANFSDAILSYSNGAALGGAGMTTSIFDFAGRVLGQNNAPIIRSKVEVSLAEIGHFPNGDARKIPLTIPSVTAIGTGSWSASGSIQGSNSTCKVVGNPLNIARDLKPALTPFQWLVNKLEANKVDFGIIKPDIVPEGSLQADGVIAPWTNVPVDAQKDTGPNCP